MAASGALAMSGIGVSFLLRCSGSRTRCRKFSIDWGQVNGHIQIKAGSPKFPPRTRWNCKPTDSTKMSHAYMEIVPGPHLRGRDKT